MGRVGWSRLGEVAGFDTLGNVELRGKLFNLLEKYRYMRMQGCRSHVNLSVSHRSGFEAFFLFSYLQANLDKLPYLIELQCQNAEVCNRNRLTDGVYPGI